MRPSEARAQTGWSERGNVSADLLLRLRPVGLALRATLLCKINKFSPLRQRRNRYRRQICIELQGYDGYNARARRHRQFAVDDAAGNRRRQLRYE